MAKKFPEAVARVFTNVYVCKKCKAKLKADPMKVIQGQIKCRKCASRALRPKRKERKVA